jgi:hypothetical protein
MALAGVHITFGGSNVLSSGGDTLPFVASSSETMAAPALSTKTAPPIQGALLSISASASIYYVTGPNATLAQVTDGVTPRRYMDPTFGREDIFVNPGDKFAWTTA